MSQIGLAAATELGPEGFLSATRLQAIGGFTPLLLHLPNHDPLWDAIDVLERYAATGERTLVLSADSGLAGYDTLPTQQGSTAYPADVAPITGHARTQGYDGWYVPEEDTVLTEEPPDEGPAPT
jgi:hypothetical protein